jgi:hypothetical protein
MYILLKRLGAALLLPALITASAVRADEVEKTPAGHGLFHDPEDGNFDLSEWLLDRKGFLPIPIIITEPAVGNGLGIAPLFFRQSMRESAQNAQGGHVTPPDIFGLAVAATENGSKAAGLGGMFSFDDDRWRYRGVVGMTDLNLDFYGVGGALGDRNSRISYNLKGLMSSQQVLRRLGDSNHFLALRWLYMDVESHFDPAQPRPRLPDLSLSRRSSGLGLSWEYDSRDNTFTPSRGLAAAVDTMFYMPSVGSDNTFQSYRAHAFVYQPLAKTVVLGGRLDGRAARGDVPFYQLPFVDMRGVPAARYQDKNVAVAETELRWNVTSRWAAIGFIGAGRAWGDQKSFGDAGSVVSKGVGARYLLARRLGLFVGADYAWGPEDRVFYLQIGSAWR